jgi:hypothetical protein
MEEAEQPKDAGPLLLACWCAGGCAGFLAGVLAAILDRGLSEWEWSLVNGDIWRWYFVKPMAETLPIFCICGVMLGVACGAFWSLAGFLYRPARSPLFAAAFYGFGGGCIWLLNALFVIAIQEEQDWMQPGRALLLLGHLGGTLLVGATYGFLLALLAAPIERWLINRTRSR